MSDNRNATIREFNQAVNMTANDIEHWLDSEHSKEVGQKASDEAESTGHKSGRRIVELLQAKHADYTDDDLEFMRHVLSYIKRHSAQRPHGDIEDTRWRYSLMNWGHDPLKK